MRLGELHHTLSDLDDVTILYVLPDVQVNDKTRRFVDESGMRTNVRVLVDENSAYIDQLGLRRPDPEPMEAGVPHPSTYVIDRAGNVRLADVRADYHIWIDSNTLKQELAKLE